jgi:hypothetical protein
MSYVDASIKNDANILDRVLSRSLESATFPLLTGNDPQPAAEPGEVGT